MDKNKLAVDVFNKQANVYAGKFMDVSLYHDSLDLFCNSIPNKNASILELACGPGNITKYLLTRRPDFKILATDLAPNMLHLANAHNPGIDVRLMDCRAIRTIGKKYNAIMCGFCLPYLSKEEAINLIGDSAGLLEPGGLLYLSTMEDDYSRSGIQTSSTGDQLYMYYHEGNYLVTALEENGLKIIDLRRQAYPTTDGTKVTDLVIIAGK